MSKKQKKIKEKIEREKKEIIKLKDFELEEILKENKEKSKQEITKIKSLKEIKPIDLDTFQEFLQISNKLSPPVLNKIETFQEIINLEKGIENESSTNPDKETKENIGNYVINSPNYSSNIDEINSQDKEYQPAPGPPILGLRETFRESPRSPLLNFGNKKTTDKKKNQSEFIDMGFTRSQKIRDTLPFEEDEKKYEEFRP